MTSIGNIDLSFTFSVPKESGVKTKPAKLYSVSIKDVSMSDLSDPNSTFFKYGTDEGTSSLNQPINTGPVWDASEVFNLNE